MQEALLTYSPNACSPGARHFLVPQDTNKTGYKETLDNQALDTHLPTRDPPASPPRCFPRAHKRDTISCLRGTERLPGGPGKLVKVSGWVKVWPHGPTSYGKDERNKLACCGWILRACASRLRILIGSQRRAGVGDSVWTYEIVSWSMVWEEDWQLGIQGGRNYPVRELRQFPEVAPGNLGEAWPVSDCQH